MSYKNTFIKVSPDCPVTSSVVPQHKTSYKPIHVIQYELLSRYPYRYTHEQLLFEIHIRHKNIPADELETNRQQIWDALFSKSHACLRASQLPKNTALVFIMTLKAGLPFMAWRRPNTNVSYNPAMRLRC